MSNNRSKIWVMRVDDRIVLREGMHAVLEAEDDMEVIAEATTAEEARSYWESLQPEVAVTSPRLAPVLEEQCPGARLVILHNADISPHEVVQAVRGRVQAPNGIQEARRLLRSYLMAQVEKLYPITAGAERHHGWDETPEELSQARTHQR